MFITLIQLNSEQLHFSLSISNVLVFFFKEEINVQVYSFLFYFNKETTAV